MRSLFISKGAVRFIQPNNIWTYTPHSNILSAAVYQTILSHTWVEYKCQFHTNQLGMIDTNYDSKDPTVDYVILGASYLEGHGGCPWLNNETTSKEGWPKLINAGLQNSGIQDLEERLNWLKSQIYIRNVIIISISNDFKRPLQKKSWQSSKECLDLGKCSLENDYWWGVDYDISNDDLIKIGQKRLSSRQSSIIENLHNILFYYSTFYNRIYKLYLYSQTPKQVDFKKYLMPYFSPNFEALGRIRLSYPQMKLILVPQRDEVGYFGNENLDTKIVKEYLNENQYDWMFCRLDMSDYMFIDGHPNKQGYSKLSSCLRSLMLEK